MTKEEEQERKYKLIEIELLESVYDTDLNYDNLSKVNCYKCGTRLTLPEVEAFEDICESCIWEDTAGLSRIEDDSQDDDGC